VLTHLFDDVTEFVGLDFAVSIGIEKVHERPHLLFGELKFGAKVLREAVHELRKLHYKYKRSRVKLGFGHDQKCTCVPCCLSVFLPSYNGIMNAHLVHIQFPAAVLVEDAEQLQR